MLRTSGAHGHPVQAYYSCWAESAFGWPFKPSRNNPKFSFVLDYIAEHKQSIVLLQKNYLSD
jgi:hypothetical protein